MQNFYVFGLNYNTADLSKREQFAFSYDEVELVLTKLLNAKAVKEGLVLSTCNRSEIYFIAEDGDFVINNICAIKNICPNTLREYTYVKSNDGAIKHLFNVVSGLDSMILGETEIVSQVKQSFDQARNLGAIATNLSGIFQMALSVEKEVRNVTQINNITRSMGSVVLSLVKDFVKDSTDNGIAFIGSGQMMSQIVFHFAGIDIHKTIYSRQLDNAVKLANTINAQAVDLTLVNQVSQKHNVIIACSGSHGYILTDVSRFDPQEQYLIIDISVPKVVSPNISSLHNVQFYNVDDLASCLEISNNKRQLAAVNASSVIDNKIEEYHIWLHKRGIAPLIKSLRDDFEAIRVEVLATAEKKLQNGEPASDVLKYLSISMVNKLLHKPTINLCSTDDYTQSELRDYTIKLFDLDLER